MSRDSFTSRAGEVIPTSDYERWLRQANDAYHVLDNNFPARQDGALHPDDRQAQLSDLLCGLRHYAEVTKLDFDAAIGGSESNYEAEQPSRVPRWAREMVED